MNDQIIDPLWRLSDPLTVQQASALIAGFDPNLVRFDSNNATWFENESGHTDAGGIGRVQAAFSALVNAISARKLKAVLRYDAEPRYNAGIDNLKERGYWGGEDVKEIKDGTDDSYVIGPVPDWAITTVARSDVTAWLSAAGIRSGFFFPDASNDAPDYLDSNHPRYAPKLAAAVKVWLAMEDENLRRTKRAYSASEQWLQINYRELGLMHEKDSPKHGTKAGDPNASAIGMIANIVNWEPTGGATKTPCE